MKFQNIPKVQLEENEKKILLNNLVSFMEKNPVRKGGVGRLIEWRNSNFRNSLTPKNMYALMIKPLSLFVSVFVAMGGGTAYAAQSSAPGDILYPYKIHVNENLKTILAVSDESKAKLHTYLAKERLSEGEKLAIKGKLDTETNIYLQTKFDSHMKEGYENIAKLKDGDDSENVIAAEIDSDFKSHLKLHEEKLLEIKSRSDSENSIQVQGLLNIIKPGAPDVKGSAEGKLNAAENKLQATIRFVQNKSDSIDAETKAEAEAKIEASQALIVEGKAQLEDENYTDATETFQEAFEISQEATAIVNAGSDSDDENENGAEVETDEDDDNNDGDEDTLKLDEKLDVDLKVDTNL